MLKIPSHLKAPVLSSNATIVLSKRYFRHDKNGEIVENGQELFWRVASAIAEQESAYAKNSSWTVEPLAEAFYTMMTEWQFLPNSPTLMNAGTAVGQLSACFVLPIGDSIEEIFDAVKYAAMIHKSGGGTGFSFSRLRPKDSRVGSTGGIASGPVSFLRIFNTATEQIKQGGTRRGANMGILRVDHPDVIEFIKAKEHDGDFNNFNLSIGLTEEFMAAVEQDLTYPLIDPSGTKNGGTLRAREVFELLVSKAWQGGDPGIVFLDRINRDNPTPDQGEIESTNPCGEQPLLPYEACNLGSINLARFFLAKKGAPKSAMQRAESCIDWQELERIIFLAVRFLDNVVEASKFPIPRITECVQKNRKIGLGIMGWADLLYQLRIPYDTPDAITLAERVMAFVHEKGREASTLLAKERGPFPAFATSKYATEGIEPLRNATITTIAPTGTLSILAGCSSGVEPLFALSFTRNVMDGEQLVEVNPYFEEALKTANCYTKELMEEVTNSNSIRDLEALPEPIRTVFVTAMDIAPEWHLRMQAAFQRFTDNAVSKTVNLPSTATIEDIHAIYWMAFEEGCKGVTVYRDGSKSSQVLTTKASQEPQVESTTSIKPATKVRSRPDIVMGFTQKVATGLGDMYLTINEQEGRPFEVFATIGKSGNSITAKAEAIGRLVSLALRSGVEVLDIVAQLKGIGGEHPIFQKKGLLLSIPDAIAWVLESHYLKGVDVAAVRAQRTSLDKNLCPDCATELTFQEGCHSCTACGYTKCGG